MEFKRNNLFSITTNIVLLTIFFIISIVLYSLLIKLHIYYSFITIPMLFLFITLTLENIIILFLTILDLVFGRNDNDEVNNFVEKSKKRIKTLCKYILIGIFTALLSSIMILDIILCVTYEKDVLVALSIVIWILLYYMLFKKIVKMIRKEIRL